MKQQLKLISGLYLQGMILLLALFGSLYSFLWSFELPVRTGVLNMVLVLYGLVFLLIYSTKKWWMALTAAMAAGAVWTFYHVNELEWGALNLFRQLLLQFDAHSTWSFIHIPETGLEASVQLQLDTQAVLFVLFFVAAISGYSVIRRPSLMGLLLLTLPFAVVPMIFMIVPPLPALGCLIASYVMLYVFCMNTGISPFLKIRRKSRKKDTIILSRAQRMAVWMMLPVVLLSLVFSSFILPQQDYSRPESIDRLRSRVDHFVFGGSLGGGLRMGSLNNLGSLRFTGKTVLKVKTTNESPLYLRGYAGSVYNGESWVIPAEEDYEQAMEYPVSLNPQNYYAEDHLFMASMSASSLGKQRNTAYELSVKNLSSDRSALFLPNGLITDVSELGNAHFVQDVYGAAGPFNDANGYTVRAFTVAEDPPDIKFGSDGEEDMDLEQLYLTPSQAGAASETYRARTGSDGLPYSDFRQMQQTYRRYVYNTYTTLPEETKQSAEALCAQYGLDPVFLDDNTGLGLDLNQTCHRVASLLDERCDYTNRPEKIPEDKDFASYFLNESREGYCVHFATTATVLLRAMGIPARYAEGYVITESDYKKDRDSEGYISIADSRAHAWVEVFNPVQMEWFPVEMTPSFSTAEGLGTENDRFNRSSSSTTQPSTHEEWPVPSALPEPVLEAEAPEVKIPEADTAIGRKALAAFGVAGLFAGILFAVCLLRRKLICSRRQRLTHQEDIDSAVLEASRWILAMLRFAGCPDINNLDSPEDYTDAVRQKLPQADASGLLEVLLSAQKARFSNTGCSEVERQAVINFGNNLLRQLSSKLCLKSRLRFYYIECLG